MKKYKDFGNQGECTLHPFDNNQEDKEYLENLFIKIASVCPNIQISSIRSNYDIHPLLKRLYEFEDELSYLRFDRNWIDLAYSGMKFNPEFATVLVDLWYNFEENRFVFYQKETDCYESDDLLNLVLDSSENIVKRTKAYFLVGGGVSDFIKIYKSNDLEFCFLV